jgi:hypothetical protein
VDILFYGGQTVTEIPTGPEINLDAPLLSTHQYSFPEYNVAFTAYAVSLEPQTTCVKSGTLPGAIYIPGAPFTASILLNIPEMQVKASGP